MRRLKIGRTKHHELDPIGKWEVKDDRCFRGSIVSFVLGSLLVRNILVHSTSQHVYYIDSGQGQLQLFVGVIAASSHSLSRATRTVGTSPFLLLLQEVTNCVSRSRLCQSN
jgi:hypothetical protein